MAAAVEVAVCCEPAGTAPAGAGAIVLLGNPNVGKSALFGALTGTYVTVSNYPGTTVEVARGWASIGGARRPIVDTPGAASLVPSSEDERVARDIVMSDEVGALIVVGDAKNLERAVLLALQVAETGQPFVLCLNMMDEAETRGIVVDRHALAARLGVDVVATVAVRHEGIGALRRAAEAPRAGHTGVIYPADVEPAAAAIAALLPAGIRAPRALALMLLSGDQTLAEWVAARTGPMVSARIENVRAEAQRGRTEPLAVAIQLARLSAARALVGDVSHRASSSPSGSRAFAQRLEVLCTHPRWGYAVLGLVLFAAYLFVGVLGAGTLVELLEEGLFGSVINPFVTTWTQRLVPWAIVRDLVVGPYGVLTMALTYSLALVLPIVGTFFIAFGVLEDSGYLPRLAVMLDRAMRRIGLNGKAVLPMVLGLGCDTMATLTTRILETPKERLIVILLLALGVPCSAQLTVILAMLGGLGPLALLIWGGVVFGTIALVGRLAARVLPGRTGDFILELPPLRLPRPGNILVKTMARVEWYLKEAVPLFVVGTLLLFVADRLHLLGGLQRFSAPVLTGLLGLPRETAEAFVVGFLRRDFGAAGLYRLAADGRLDGVQVVVAMVTITLFIPCIANFFMIVKERGWRTSLAVAGFIFPFAVGVGALLNVVLRALRVPL